MSSAFHSFFGFSWMLLDIFVFSSFSHPSFHCEPSFYYFYSIPWHLSKKPHKYLSLKFTAAIFFLLSVLFIFLFCYLTVTWHFVGKHIFFNFSVTKKIVTTSKHIFMRVVGVTLRKCGSYNLVLNARRGCWRFLR